MDSSTNNIPAKWKAVPDSERRPSSRTDSSNWSEVSRGRTRGVLDSPIGLEISSAGEIDAIASRESAVVPEKRGPGTARGAAQRARHGCGWSEVRGSQEPITITVAFTYPITITGTITITTDRAWF
jgi:hypothetical protein